MSLPYSDPSNPALPSPLFSGITATRGDHLRANNNTIFTDLSYLDTTMDARWLRTLYGDNEYGSTLSTDLNAITKSGLYTCLGTAADVPDAGFSWLVLHQNSAVGVDSAYQRAVAFSTSLIVYERTKILSTWGAWKIAGGEVTTVTLSGSTYTLTEDQLRASMIIFAGASSSVTVTWPVSVVGQCRIKNSTAYTLYIKTPSGSGIYAFAGDVWDLYCDGTNVNPLLRNINRLVGYEQMTADTYMGYPVYEKVLDCGTLPNSTSKPVAHGITGSFTILPDRGVTGMTTDGTAQRPIPTALVGGLISIYLSTTSINIETSTNMSSYTKTWVMLRYVKAAI